MLVSCCCFCGGPVGEGRGLCNGPSVVAEHDRWTVYSSKVNLPAALNDPRLAKRESDFFTKTWGLDFTETEVMPSFYLPNITRDHFGPYLQEMAQVTPELFSACLIGGAHTQRGLVRGGLLLVASSYHVFWVCQESCRGSLIGLK